MVQLSNTSENGGFNVRSLGGKAVGVFCYLTTPNTSAYCLYVYRCAQGIIFIGRKSERF